MATLTNPVEEQNVVNRFADYVPPAANTGISYGTNSIPPNGMASSYFGGTTGGRGIGVSGASIKNNGELIDASGIQDILEAETVQYSAIRSLRATRTVTGGGGNTGSQGSPGIINDNTGIAYMNTSYAQSLPARNISISTGQIIDDAVLEQKFNDLRNQYNSNRNNTTTVNVNICHASCHSSCHSSRGRR